MDFKTTITNLNRFTLNKDEFNSLLTVIQLYRPESENPEILARVENKLMKKSLYDLKNQEMHCALNEGDFQYLFSVLICISQQFIPKADKDYFSECINDPEVKPWIIRSKKY